jgi:membrane fusion protein (multidrug efflux system)
MSYKSIATAVLLAVAVTAAPAFAQRPPSGPPAVGVAPVQKQSITETEEFVGRIQATNHVDIVARVTAFIEQQKFVEGAEVKRGDLLYLLEQPPFEADLHAKQASVAQLQAQLQNANIQLGRAQALLNTPAGQRSTVDDARANQLALAAQVMAAQAQLDVSEINLGYTEIRAPIAGKIGRTAVTIGNVVTPSSGVLTTIVSQDPMYVVFPIANRTAIELRNKYSGNGGFSAVKIRIRLPDGRMYAQTGLLNFVDNTISANTDTITLRGNIPNPPLATPAIGDAAVRELTDGEFVTVLLEGVAPVQVLGIPRAAVLSDQLGDYVFVVGEDNKVTQTRIKLGQSTATIAVVVSGLTEGQSVVVDGLQRVHNGQEVKPGPAAPTPQQAQATGPGGEPGSAAPGSPTPASAPKPAGSAASGGTQ